MGFHICITGSPKYPQSNSAAERAVRNIEDIKQDAEWRYLYGNVSLMIDTINGLNAEFLMVWKFQTNVPVIPQELNPKLPNNSQLGMRES